MKFMIVLGLCAVSAGVAAGINPWLGLVPIALVGVATLVRYLAAGRPETLRGALGRDGKDSWGGRAIVLLGASVVLSAFLTRVVDGTMQRTDKTGERYLVSGGTVGQTLGAAMVLAAVVCAVIAIASARGSTSVGSWYSRWMLAAVAWWIACALVLRLEWASLRNWYECAAAVLIAIAAIKAPPTRKTLLTLTHLLNFTVISLLAYGFANPGQQLPCRADKCGIFDSLFTGYLFQENSAARLVVLLIPVAWVVPSRAYLAFTLAGSGVFVFATGSRTSELTYLVAVAAVLWLRWVHRDGEPDSVRVYWVLRIAPLAFLLGSLYAFLFATGSSLTDRGAIYAGIRERLTGWSLLVGSGPDTVENLRLGFRPSGEHGQVPHLLAQAGVPMVILFGAALAALLIGSRWSTLQATAFGLLLVTSTQFITEPPVVLEVRSMPFALLLLTVGLFIPRESAPDPATASTSSARPALTP